MVNYLDRLIKYGLYCLVFLMPIFFLPWTVSPVSLNKQTLLAVFCFLILIFWLIKIIVSGEIDFVWDRLTQAVFLLLIVLGSSTLFAGSRAHSFWGMNIEPDSFFSFILYGLVFFLFANLLESRKQILEIILIFLGSNGILAVVLLIQSFWGFIRFNPVGSVQVLAIFLGGSLSILITMVGFRPSLKRKTIWLSVVLGVLLFTSLLLIDYYIAWLMIASSMAIIIFVLLKNINKTRIFALPLTILIIALILVFIQSPFKNVIDTPFEVKLTHKASLNIAQKTISESVKNFILGSGPATFAYDHDLYRSASPNMTDFWNVRFSQGTTVPPTLLAANGILGILAVLFVILAFCRQGFEVLNRLEQDRKTHFTRAITLISGFYFLIFWLFYSINFGLFFVSFLMLGLFSFSASKSKDHFKSGILFTKSPPMTFLAMLICGFLIVGSVIGIYRVGQRYVGALAFAKGLDFVNAQESDLDQGIISLNRAVDFDKNDTYFRNLSQVYILKINELLSNHEQKQEMFQQTVINAEHSALAASRINPLNSHNWLQLARVYKNFISLEIRDADKLAVLNYQKAIELAPKSPELSFGLGGVYKAMGDLESAIKELQKSIQLKPDFAPAYYLLSRIYEAQGNKDLALQGYQILLRLEPGNEKVIRKIQELK